MVNSDQNIKRLIELIKGSASFTDVEKAQMIQNIPQTSEVEIIKAIQVFEQEKADWKALKAEGDYFLKMVKDYSYQSQQELERDVKHLIAQKEAQVEKKEGLEAEDLLITI